MIMIITLLTGKTSKLKEKIKDELDLEIKINQSSRSKKLTLKVDGKSNIPILSMPGLCSQKRAFEFVKAHLDWLEEKLSQSVAPQKFKNGDKFSLFGQELEIKHSPELRAGVVIEGGLIKVSGETGFLHRRVKDFIKKQAKDKLKKLSQEKAAILGYKINNVVIKDTKSRWGSCSSNSNINYNWRIALAPEYVTEYLVSHEVSHLKHQDHSKDFWACVKTLMPDYVQGKNWLRTKGKELYIYE